MMRNAVLVLAVLATYVAHVSACGAPVMSQTFDKYTGAYKTWNKPMGKEDFEGFIFLKLDSFSTVGEQTFRVENPKGCVGTAECGATFDVKLPPMQEATLTYKFMHSPGYVYGRGGKLPGLCDMDCPSGCEVVTEDSGFSARVMWREEDLMSYSYYAGKTQDHCGENWYWDQKAVSGEWHTIRMYVKLNSAGKADGAQIIEYDGKVVYSASDIEWAARPAEHPIEKFTFRSFHGGSSDSWASAQDQYIYFDDIMVSEGNCVGEATPTTTNSDPARTTATPAAAPVPATTPSAAPTSTPETPSASAPEPEEPSSLVQAQAPSPDPSQESAAPSPELLLRGQAEFVEEALCGLNWKRCESSCCDETFHCVQKHATYNQCRPKDREIPDGWDGTILG